MKFESHGGKGETQAQRNFQLAKAAAIFLLVVGLSFGAYFGISRWLSSQQETKPAPAPTATCSHIIPDSIFTTGDPLTDQRVLYAIINDKSADHTASGELVEHLWTKQNFAFTGAAEKLWEEANTKVTSISAIDKPALSITQSGVIVPYHEPKELADVTWTEVRTTQPPAARSTMLMVSTAGKQSTSPAPVVLLSITGNTIVPSPTLGTASEQRALQAQKVCS